MEDTRTQKFFQNSLMNLSLFSPFDKQPFFLLHQTPHTHTRKNKGDRLRRNRRKNRLLKGQKMARQHGNSKSRSRTKKTISPNSALYIWGLAPVIIFSFPLFLGEGVEGCGVTNFPFLPFCSSSFSFEVQKTYHEVFFSFFGGEEGGGGGI